MGKGLLRTGQLLPLLHSWQLFGTCGKLLISLEPHPWNAAQVMPHLPVPTPTLALLLTLLRALALPLFLVCNLVPHKRFFTPILIHSDVAYIVLMLIFSISTGILTRWDKNLYQLDFNFPVLPFFCTLLIIWFGWKRRRVRGSFEYFILD